MTNEARKYLEKAERALRAAETLLLAHDSENAAGRAYYAMLHTAQALLHERGLRYRKHGGVHAGFGEHFAKAGVLDQKYHRWLLDAYDDRLRGDYDIEVSFTEAEVNETIGQAREFVQTARQWLDAQSGR